VPARHDTRDAGICDSLHWIGAQTRQDAILNRDIQPVEKFTVAYLLPLSGGLNGIVDGLAYLHRSELTRKNRHRYKYLLAFTERSAYTKHITLNDTK
jgi:hypothetical protein